jgi:uncharacterized membrane protein
MRSRVVLLSVAVLVVALSSGVAAARQTDPVVRGVLFFSPTCSHCEYVIQEVLPPLYEEHGGPWELVYDTTLPETELAYFLLTNGTLEMLLVDVTVAAGGQFFEATTEALAIGSNGVPRLIVSNQVMIGSADIPNRLPRLIDQGLAGEGIDWPLLPGMEGVVAALPVPTPTSTTTTTTPVVPTTTATATTVPVTTTTTEVIVAATLPLGGDVERGIGDDPAGTAVAIVVLVLLVTVLVWIWLVSRRDDLPYRPGGLVPFLVLLGIVIAAYLTYVELGGAEAVCGPVGDCHVVQESDYSTVAGVPNGILGLAGYLGIGLLWMLSRRPSGRRSDLARVGVATIAAGGVAFSAWLTFAEAFLIHATCAWCIGSALVIAALAWLVVPDGVAAWRRIAPVSDVEELAA